ncbi:MAG: adenylate kinase [Treponemataceae bacterium]|nr:adenylate kinase [Spirochaetales bacterium]MDY6030779.1 adenylate kinase [Treponemataceae bacterium]
MNFIFLGPPGAGKGTLAKEAAKFYNIPHISTGDIFRENIKNQTELGKKAKAIIDAGGLVSDEITIDLVKDRLSKDDTKNGYILDGFPRTIPQAEALEKFAKIDAAVNFDIEDEAVVDRLGGRVCCKDCGQMYHVKTMPPKVAGKCDKCGGELYTRDDDKPESIQNRLVVYRNSTAPLIDFYRNKNLLVDIDAKPAPEKVLEIFKQKFSK